ncbi:hypothetical protein ACFSCZ_08865 [Siminovitchia sediminis]|uniref:Uncharacterized protein n=1 Tax=Siminovitchia sediminis TaxID=1274353 RepID=A0ABW4KJ90_9BACI
MIRERQGESLERLVSDLIFKLGKAHQQIHHLTQRVEQLEHLLHQQTPGLFLQHKSKTS